jgi:hypothetical protein
MLISMQDGEDVRNMDVSSSEEMALGAAPLGPTADLSQQVAGLLKAMEVLSLNLQKTTASQDAKLLSLTREVRSGMSRGSSASLVRGRSTERTEASPLDSHRKLWESSTQERAGSGSRTKVSFSDLEKDVSDEEDEDEDELEELLAEQSKGGDGKGAQLSDLIQLKMLKMLGKLEDNKEGSSDDEDGRTRGFKGVRKLREKWKKQPQKIVRNFVERTKEELGVSDDRQVWRFRDLNRKLRPAFGKLVGIHKCHGLVMDIVQLMHDKEFKLAHAYAVQVSKALHQVGLDQGSWDTAQLLVPLPEASSSSKFGGDEMELEAVFAYRKSLRELSKKQYRAEKKGQAEDEESEDSDKDKDKDKKDDGKKGKKPFWKTKKNQD